MASAAPELTEPHVLAHTKRRLFPDGDTENTYAVVDTQFAQERWIDDQRIDDEIPSWLESLLRRVGLEGVEA